MTSTPTPDTLTCPACGQAGKPGQKFCNRCGVPLVAAAPACPRCGALLKSTSRFCPDCGMPSGPQAPAPAGAAVPPVPAGAAAPPVPAGSAAAIRPAMTGAAVPPASPAGKPGGSQKTLLIIGAVVLVAILAIGAFVLLSGSSSTSPVGPLEGPLSSMAKKAGSQPVHGTITTGPVTQAASGTIPAGGGTVTVNDPGSAINGLVLTAPAGAYPAGQQVTISSAPITGHTFGQYCTPATPMISINAGEEYAGEIVTLRIPVTVPDDHFAMAFYYDEAAGKLEGIPTAGRDSTSITIATRHFSKVFVSVVPVTLLNGVDKSDSGFRPGTDDWEFVNFGSAIAPDGHCAGQSATMMWYYTEQRQKNGAPALYGRYDNNGREKTPLFDRDNTQGYRFASVMQEKMLWDEYARSAGALLTNVSDLNAFREFRYSILMTGEPQFVYIDGPGGAHAIVCYEVSDNKLWVADPNFPGKERMIVLNRTTDTFDPYASGQNAQDIQENGVRIYPTIRYMAKSALFSWETLAQEYAKVGDNTIGESEFPGNEIRVYTIYDTGKDTVISIVGRAGRNSELHKVEVKEKTVRFRDLDPADTTAVLYAGDGSIITRTPITLKEGSNIFAYEVFHKRTGEWMGFDWFDIVYKPDDAAPVSTTAALQASRGLTRARAYVQSDAALGGDPDCRYAGNVYADTSCVAAGTPGGGFWNTLPFCGSPPDKCIDTRANSGLQEEYTYYTKEETDQYGTSRLVSVRDGWDLHYDSNWGVSTKEFYKDGSQVGSCYLVTSPATSWSCEGQTT